MSREDYRERLERRQKAKALRLRRAGGRRAKRTQREAAGAVGCYRFKATRKRKERGEGDENRTKSRKMSQVWRGA